GYADRHAQGDYRAQGQIPVPSAEARADRARFGPGHARAAAADRRGRSARAPQARRNGLTKATHRSAQFRLAGLHAAASGYDILSHKDRKSTRLNSSHVKISYAVFCLKKKTFSPAPPHAR